MIALFRLTFLVACLGTLVMAVLPHPPTIPGDPPDKVLHILAFAVLGSLAAVAFPKRAVGRIVAALIALGALIEVVQAIPALNRDSEFLDLVSDSVAALVAAWVVRRATGGRVAGSEPPD